VLAGHPADAISRTARAEGASLVVVGKRGRNPLQELVLGSTAEGRLPARRTARAARAVELVMKRRCPGACGVLGRRTRHAARAPGNNSGLPESTSPVRSNGVNYRRWTTLVFLTATSGIAALAAVDLRRAYAHVDGAGPRVRLASGEVQFQHGGTGPSNHATLPNERIAAIRAPTLVVHARDDMLQRYRNAEFAVAHIPRARLLSFDDGGHLLVAVERAVIRSEVQAFIRQHE
jgi:pimeloyl-ACP methyl ester carboxylesterase